MNNSTSYVIIACYPDKGMKSYGSKSLIEFSKKKLLQHQIDCIKSLVSNNKKTEIIVVSDFETVKLQKYFGNQTKIVELNDYNPIYTGCLESKYDHIVFVDYGCVFNKHTINNLKDSCVVINDNKNSKLEIGCIVDDRYVKHIFFDLPENRFCNIFSISPLDKNKILHTDGFDYFNLLSFEIINMLLDSGSVFKTHNIKNDDFLFFNHMRQKNAVNKFIKKIPN